MSIVGQEGMQEVHGYASGEPDESNMSKYVLIKSRHRSKALKHKSYSNNAYR